MMTAEQFLASVWTDAGIYCIAMPFNTGKGFEHHTFDNVADAAKFAKEQSNAGRDVYFNIHTLKEPQVYNPQLKDRNGTVVGGWQTRVHSNMRGASCFFADVDVGPDKPYKDRKTAISAVAEFVTRTKLPYPTVVTSGGGFHLYWPLDGELPGDEWWQAATTLKRLAQKFEFHLDPARTTDRSSVLRVPDTLNFKNRAAPRKVHVQFVGKPTARDAFLEIINRNTIFTGDPAPPSIAEQMVDEKAVNIVQLGRACGVVRHLVANAATHSEPEWHAFLGLMLFTENGREWAHKVSSRYPTYSREETDEKLARVAENQTGPTRCQRLADLGHAGICNACWYNNQRDKSAPTVAARRMARKVQATDVVPPPPKPYTRLEIGGVGMDNDGAISVISPYDLYPTMLVEEANGGDPIIQSNWTAIIPRRDPIQMKLPLSTVQDPGKLSARLADHGVILQHDNVKHVRHYMSAYIQMLQKSMGDQRSMTHLGWANDFKEFVMPDVVYTATGTKPAAISETMRGSLRTIKRKGTLQQQVAALGFYNDPTYHRHQFIIGCSLGAPLFYMTGQFGVNVNASGHTGASKSTALYSAASLWGDGEHYTINGTNVGASQNFRQHRMAVLSNLPLCLDEITFLPPDEAKDMVMSITQPETRAVMTREGKEKQQTNPTSKATILLTSSNGSLHEKLSIKNIAGTASSMRVFEIDCPQQTLHTKVEADAYMRVLRENHGHIGPAFIEYVAAHTYAVQQQVVELLTWIDTKYKIAPHERFWSAPIAAAIVGLRIAKKLGLLPYNPEAVLQWALEEQLPAMRGVVETTYTSPLEFFLAYINGSQQDVLAVSTSNGRVMTLGRPTRALGIRMEIDTGDCYVALSHLKLHCIKENYNYTSLLNALTTKHGASQVKITLGKGIPELTSGQVRCLKIQMQQEAIAGKPEPQAASPDNVVQLKRGA